MENYLEKYKKQLTDIEHILRYLQTYPEILAHSGLTDLMKPEKLYAQYIEWLDMCNKFTGEEKEFFKKNWLPIDDSSIDYFIDLSDDRYPIITMIYNQFNEPYCWLKKIYFPSIIELMLAHDNDIDLKKHRLDSIYRFYKDYL